MTEAMEVAAAEVDAMGCFVTPELAQKTNLLLHLTENSDRIALVKGIEGSGKSTLLSRFVTLAPNKWTVCRVDANPLIQPDQLFDQLCKCFDIDFKGTTLEVLLQRFEYLQLTGNLPVVVVDDAHLLPVATIIALFRLFERRAQNTPLVKILLFASPEMDAYLKTPQMQVMNLQLLQVLEMPCLSKGQTEAFAAHLLEQEGVAQHFKLTIGDIDRLFRESAGAIGRIEESLRQLMQGRRIEPPERIDGKTSLFSKLSPMALAGGVTLVGLIVLVLVFQQSINDLFSPGAADGELPILDSVSSEPVTPITVPADEEPAGELLAQSDGQQAFRQDQPHETLPLSLPEITQPVDEGGAFSATGSDAEEPSESERQFDQPQIPLGDHLEQSVEEPSADIPVAESGRQTDLPEPVLRPEPVQAPKQVQQPASGQPQTTSDGLSAAERALLQEKPTAYTLQLIGVHDAEAAREFISRHGLQGKAQFFRTSLKGKPWYSVVYGVYSSRDAAAAARATLPGSLRRSDSWPRPLSSVQEAIRQR